MLAAESGLWPCYGSWNRSPDPAGQTLGVLTRMGAEPFKSINTLIAGHWPGWWCLFRPLCCWHLKVSLSYFYGRYSQTWAGAKRLKMNPFWSSQPSLSLLCSISSIITAHSCIFVKAHMTKITSRLENHVQKVFFFFSKTLSAKCQELWALQWSTVYHADPPFPATPSRPGASRVLPSWGDHHNRWQLAISHSTACTPPPHTLSLVPTNASTKPRSLWLGANTLWTWAEYRHT